MILASIVITTRNRRDDTLRAVATSFAQDCPDLEVLVIDDASDDGTAEAVRSLFPCARVIASSARTGYIVNRNRGFRAAQGRYVFSLDDDAYFSAPDIVARTVSRFAREPMIGAVAIPYIEPLGRRSLSSLAHPFKLEAGSEIASFTGCAHAIRLDVALALGGYREYFVHQGEERDLCLRMRAAGWRIVYGDSRHVVHMVSARREAGRSAYYGGRNQILFETLNAPAGLLPMRLARSIGGIIRYRFSWSTAGLKASAIGAGFAESARRLSERRPVAAHVYSAFRALPGHGPEDWEGDVPPPCSPSRAFA